MAVIVSRKVAWPLMTGLSFAGSFIAGKYIINDLQPLTIGFLRYLIALLFLSGLLFYHRAGSLKIAIKDILPMALLGLFGVVGYQFFFFASLNHTAVINTSIINAFSPVVTGAIAAVFISERLARINYAGIIAAVVGVVILVSRGSISNILSLNFNIGDILMLCAVFSWAIYAVLIKRLLEKYSGFTLTYYAALFGMMELGLLCLIENPVSQIRAMSGTSLIALLYLGVVATGGGHFLYNLCIGEIGPTKTSSFVYSIVPVFVAGLAFIFFDELLNSVMMLSGILIVIGLNFMLKEKTT